MGVFLEEKLARWLLRLDFSRDNPTETKFKIMMPKTVKVEFISTVKTVYDNSNSLQRFLLAKRFERKRFYV